ncbi:MAG: flavodoxin [Arcobacteraceae bacterium]|nr:flavodoxin [Arcobacteraceae bacterium]MDY0328676.1 flavodoxin [Arcobacteraceae bacterium]
MIPVFFTSSTGNSETAAKKIAKELGSAQIFDLAKVGVDEIKKYDKMIIGSSTWGEGELQDDFEEIWDKFADIDFTGKVIALFGLGDQDGYSYNYCDAMGLIYNQVVQNGGNVVGSYFDADYEFEESIAFKNGKFVGLPLDEDNQSKLTDSRIKTWCEEIKESF